MWSTLTLYNLMVVVLGVFGNLTVYVASLKYKAIDIDKVRLRSCFHLYPLKIIRDLSSTSTLCPHEHHHHPNHVLQVSQILIRHLALADLLYSLSTSFTMLVSRAAGRWVFGDILCYYLRYCLPRYPPD